MNRWRSVQTMSRARSVRADATAGGFDMVTSVMFGVFRRSRARRGDGVAPALASGSPPQSRRDPGRISRRPGRTPDRAAPAPRLREAAPEPLRLDLEQRLDRGKAGKAMPPQTAEAHAGRRRRPDRDPGPGGHHDLPAVSRRADASRGVNRQPEVPDLGQRGAAAENPHPDPDVEIVGPPALAEGTLDRHRRLDRWARLLEDREVLVGAGVDFPAAGSQHRGAEDASDVVQQ